jgi:excisionase family DNA binding protein
VTNADDLLSRAEAADLLGVSTQTVLRWGRDGILTEQRIEGTRWVRYRRGDVLELMQSVTA